MLKRKSYVVSKILQLVVGNKRDCQREIRPNCNARPRLWRTIVLFELCAGRRSPKLR